MSHSLIVDEGNTRIKYALFQEETIGVSGNCTYDSLEQLKDFIQTQKPEQAILSSVGSNKEPLVSLISEHCELIEFSHDLELPINISYKTPETLGLDRLAAAVAMKYEKPEEHCLVIDAGTCITYDILTAEGTYVGGAIGPGMDMRFRALNDYTDRLPLLEAGGELILIGDDTNQSIRMGVEEAMIKEVDAMIDSFRKQYENLHVVFTGGESSYFINRLKNQIFADPNLVLKGLNRALQYISNQRS